MKDISVTTRSLKVLVIGSIILGLAGCDKNQFAPNDSRNSAPVVTRISFTPDSIYIDNLTPVNGEYTVTTILQATAADEDGQSDLATVTVDILRGNGSVSVGGIALHDDGIAPDAVRGDGMFTGSAQFSLTRAQAGRYQARVTAVDRRGARSNSPSGQLQLTRRNSPPVVFNLDAPDSVVRPVVGNLLFTMSIAATDSDGLADVSEVYFKSLTSSTPDAKIFLYDDGGVVLRNQVPSGDRFAGDGIFSVIVQLQSSAAAGTRVFAFQARDTFGDTSVALNHPLIVR